MLIGVHCGVVTVYWRDMFAVLHRYSPIVWYVESAYSNRIALRRWRGLILNRSGDSTVGFCVMSFDMATENVAI
jgi:hypothetical protein